MILTTREESVHDSHAGNPIAGAPERHTYQPGGILKRSIAPASLTRQDESLHMIRGSYPHPHFSPCYPQLQESAFLQF